MTLVPSFCLKGSGVQVSIGRNDAREVRALYLDSIILSANANTMVNATFRQFQIEPEHKRGKPSTAFEEPRLSS